MPPATLADLTPSPERRIFDAVVNIVRSDNLIADIFSPIVTIESVTREAFANYGAFSAVIQPVSIRAEDHPSQRSTSHFGVVLSFFLPNEQTEEDSALVGLDLGGYLRSILWGLAAPDLAAPSVQITFATTEFKSLTPLIGINGATRILSYLVTFETDVDPVENDFSA